MKNVKKIFLAFVLVFSLSTSSIFAATNLTLNYNYYHKQDILLDGETIQIPSTITYSDGYELDMTSYINSLKSLSQLNVTDNNEVSCVKDNGVFGYTLSSEYRVAIDDNGSVKASIDKDTADRIYKHNILLPNRQTNLENFKNQESNALTNLYIKDYTDDIAIFSAIDTSDVTQDSVVSAAPYLYRITSDKYDPSFGTSYSDEDIAKYTHVSQTSTINYYAYSLVYRDLRLRSIKYSINGNDAVSVPSFDLNTYTYDVSLPTTTADGATISTSSVINEEAILQSNNIDKDLDLSVQEANVTLNNGKATAKVNVVFDTSNYPNEKYSSNVTRTYTINFTVKTLKGDLNKDGIINSTDASIALDLYRNSNATEEDIKIGDMDGNKIINSTDASMILDAYRYNTVEYVN